MRRGKGKREAVGHRLRGGGKTAYLAEYPTQLNRQPELCLGVVFGARGIPTLIVRHNRAGKNRATPAHSSLSFLLLKGREQRALLE